MTNGRLKQWLYILLVGGLLTACYRPHSTTPVATPTGDLPVLRLVDPPEALCRDATQMRLQPVVEGEWPADAVAAWEIRPEGEIAVVASGAWTPQARGLYVAFPDGESLPPGDYRLQIAVGDAVIAEHAFVIRGVGPQLRALSLALTPEGQALSTLEVRPHVVYLRYVYEGVCPGAPLWLTVKRAGETVCNRTLTLESQSGERAVACYRADGAPLEAGVYEATASLGGANADLTFQLGAAPEPTPTPTAVVYDPICKAPFAAVGLTPAGGPYRPQERFEWYTQSVYVGAGCQDLPSGLFWEIRWYRDGEEVRAYRARWSGDAEGVLWDALTGTEAAPFLPPGTYTATLTLADEPPVEVGFRIFAYQPQE